jgi:hypothetical protein
MNKALVAHIERFHPTYTPHEKKEVYHVLKKLENNQKKREEDDPLFGEKAYRNHVRNTQRNYNKKKYPQYHRMNNRYFHNVTSNLSVKVNRSESAQRKQNLASNKKRVEEQALQKRLQKETNETHKALRNQYCAPGQPKMFGMMCGKPPPATIRARSPRKKYTTTSAAKP